MIDGSVSLKQSVRVSLLFQGTKVFRLQKRCVTFIIIEHKVIGSPCPITPIIEVAAYSHSDENISRISESPRLFLSSQKVFRKLDASDLQIGGLIVTEGTDFAANLIAEYIYGRVVISSKPLLSGQEDSIRIEIMPLDSEINCIDDSFGPYDILHDGIRILGQLPPINNIK